jgi:hypothetical protein
LDGSVERQAGLRAFVQTPVGRVLLIAFAIALTALTYAYLYALLAIPVMLLVGFAVPIWLGIKRIRFLALLGLVVLLLAAPIANLVLTQEVMQPIPPASSATDLVGGGGGALLQGAQVSPYVGSTSTNFTWTVTVVPKYIPRGNESPYQLSLYISTCPGATGTGDPNCSSGYPFYELDHKFATNLTANTTVTFHFMIPTDGIWAWQMGAFLNNSTAPRSQNATFITLVGDPMYNGLEGPVVGTFATTYEQLLPSIYLNVFVYLGIPFYIVLVIYMYVKRRQAARGSAVARAPGPVPSESGGGGGDGPPPPVGPPLVVKPVTQDASAPRRPEMPCPSCGAVVYPNETSCWKCGAKLPSQGGSASSAPLPSSQKPS